MTTQRLLVPARWMKACGKGDAYGVFDVLRVRSYGEGRTFVTVNDRGREWDVWLEARGAELHQCGDDRPFTSQES